MTLRAHRSVGQVGGRGGATKTRARRTQPLKPRSALRSLIISGVLLVSLFVLLIVNRESLAQFINRPVTEFAVVSMQQQVMKAEVAEIFEQYKGTGFFKFDVIEFRNQLEEHPWVYQAAVKRIWPNRLAIKITEQVAIARWGSDALLNQYGDLFSPSSMRNLMALPELSGPDAKQVEVMRQYQVFNQVLFPEGLRLTGLALSHRGSWELVLNNELQVKVGRAAVTERLQRFVGFYVGLSQSQVALFDSVDLRYPNGIAVKTKEDELTGVAIL